MFLKERNDKLVGALVVGGLGGLPATVGLAALMPLPLSTLTRVLIGIAIGIPLCALCAWTGWHGLPPRNGG